MFRQFKFEEGLYPGMEAIPISTQFKLDMLGRTFPAALWTKLVLPERLVFCHLSIRSRGERECYSNYLDYVLEREKASSTPAPASNNKKPWEDIGRLPPEVAVKLRELDLPLFWPEWIKLDDMERYALFKLCRESADDHLRQAVQEFLGLSHAAPSSAT